MGSLRYAQSLNAGVLPTKDIKNVFVAQAFDAGDPCAGGNQCCTNKKDGQGGWACQSGEAPYTQQFMGGVWPCTPRHSTPPPLGIIIIIICCCRGPPVWDDPTISCPSQS